MRKALPVISEDAATLKQRLQHEHDSRKKPRLQMLYWLASGQAQTRQDVAQLLGVHRNTIGHWLARYEAGGLAALLALYIHHLDVNYHTLYTIVRTKFQAKLKVPRPSHTKKP